MTVPEAWGGGALFLAFGVVAALWEREKSGLGQVVDAAMVDGVASLMSMFLLVLIGAPLDLLERRNDPALCPEDAETLARIFLTRKRDDWRGLLEGTDACFAPVLTLDEAKDHPHLRARQTFLTRDDAVLPAPAPRFSRSQPVMAESEDGARMLESWKALGMTADRPMQD